MKFIKKSKEKNRYKRYKKVMDLLEISKKDNILDVGCGNKDRSFVYYNVENEITGLDLYKPSEIKTKKKNFRYVKGNAKNLPFKDKQFNVVVSVGMMEHIHPEKDFIKCLKEIERVGEKYAIIVPHRYGFIEPHFQVPFWYFYPEFLKRFLIKHFNLGSQKRRKDGNYQKLNHPPAKFYKNLLEGSKVTGFWWGPFLLYYIIYKNEKKN